MFYAPPPALQEKFQEKDQDDDDDDKSQVHSYVSCSVKICAQSKVILIWRDFDFLFAECILGKAVLGKVICTFLQDSIFWQLGSTWHCTEPIIADPMVRTKSRSTREQWAAVAQG